MASSESNSQNPNDCQQENRTLFTRVYSKVIARLENSLFQVVIVLLGVLFKFLYKKILGHSSIRRNRADMHDPASSNPTHTARGFAYRRPRERSNHGESRKLTKLFSSYYQRSTHIVPRYIVGGTILGVVVGSAIVFLCYYHKDLILEAKERELNSTRNKLDAQFEKSKFELKEEIENLEQTIVKYQQDITKLNVDNKKLENELRAESNAKLLAQSKLHDMQLKIDEMKRKPTTEVVDPHPLAVLLFWVCVIGYLSQLKSNFLQLNIPNHS